MAPGGTVVLAGVKGFKPVPDFVSDKIVMKEIDDARRDRRHLRGLRRGDPADRVAAQPDREDAHARLPAARGRARDPHCSRARSRARSRSTPACCRAGADADGRRARVDRRLALRRFARRVRGARSARSACGSALPYADSNSNAEQGAARRRVGVADRARPGRPSRAPRSGRTAGRGTPPRCRSATSPPRSREDDPRRGARCCGAARSSASSRSRCSPSPASRSRKRLVQVRGRFGAAPVELPGGRQRSGRHRPRSARRDDRAGCPSTPSSGSPSSTWRAAARAS